MDVPDLSLLIGIAILALLGGFLVEI